MNSLSSIGQQRGVISKSRLIDDETPDSACDDRERMSSSRLLRMNSWRKSSKGLGNSCRSLFGGEEKHKRSRKESGCNKKKSQDEKSHGKLSLKPNKDQHENVVARDRRRKSLASSKCPPSPRPSKEKLRALTPFRRRKSMANAGDDCPHTPNSTSSNVSDRDDTLSKGEKKRSGTPFRRSNFEDKGKGISPKKDIVARPESSKKKRCSTPYRNNGTDQPPKQISPLSHKQTSRRHLLDHESSSRFLPAAHSKSSKSNPARMHHSMNHLSYELNRDTRCRDSCSEFKYHQSEKGKRHNRSAGDLKFQVQAGQSTSESKYEHLEKRRRHAESSDEPKKHAEGVRDAFRPSDLSYQRFIDGNRLVKSSGDLDYRHVEKGGRYSRSSADLNYHHEKAEARVTKTFPRVTKTFGAGPSANREKLIRGQQIRVFRDQNGSTRRLQYSIVTQKSYRGIEVMPDDSVTDDGGMDEEEQNGEVVKGGRDKSDHSSAGDYAATAGKLRESQVSDRNSEETTQKQEVESSVHLQVPPELVDICEENVSNVVSQENETNGGSQEDSTGNREESGPWRSDSSRKLLPSCGNQKLNRGIEYQSGSNSAGDRGNTPSNRDSKIALEKIDAPAHSRERRRLLRRGSSRRLLSSIVRQVSYKGLEEPSDSFSGDKMGSPENPASQRRKIGDDDSLDHSPVPAAVALGPESTAFAQKSVVLSESKPTRKPLVRSEVERIEKKIREHPDFSRTRSCRNLGRQTGTTDCSRPGLPKSLSLGRLGNRSFLSGSLTGSQMSNRAAAQASVIPSDTTSARKRAIARQRKDDGVGRDCESDSSEEGVGAGREPVFSNGRNLPEEESKNKLSRHHNKRPSPVAYV